MMKAILLNGGGYYGLENVEFPVEVDCDFITLRGHISQDFLSVSKDELHRIGMETTCLPERSGSLAFLVGTHLELKSENAQ